jgi:hypothetical protein
MEKIEFDVAGTRHCDDVKKCKDFLRINEELQLEMEPENEKDSNAVKVIFINNKNEKYHLGYVPRYYSKEISDLLKKNVSYSAQVKNLNFDSPFNDEDICANVKLLFQFK